MSLGQWKVSNDGLGTVVGLHEDFGIVLLHKDGFGTVEGVGQWYVSNEEFWTVVGL